MITKDVFAHAITLASALVSRHPSQDQPSEQKIREYIRLAQRVVESEWVAIQNEKNQQVVERMKKFSG